jgi:hypothetical protein
VFGPQGYYSKGELTLLVKKSGYEVDEHIFCPGKLGTLFWESAIMASLIIGKWAFRLLILLLPLVKIAERFDSHAGGCEHIVKIRPKESACETCSN